MCLEYSFYIDIVRNCDFFEISVIEYRWTITSYTCSGAGTGGGSWSPFYQEGLGGQYCPLHFNTIVTKQTLANLKARLSKAG